MLIILFGNSDQVKVETKEIWLRQNARILFRFCSASGHPIICGVSRIQPGIIQERCSQ